MVQGLRLHAPLQGAWLPSLVGEQRSHNMLGHSVVSDSFSTPWTVARQAPLSTGILQARILECVAMPASKRSSQPKDQTQVSPIAGRFFTV